MTVHDSVSDTNTSTVIMSKVPVHAPVPTKEAQHRASNALTETTGAHAIAAQRSSEVTGDTASIVRAAWSSPLTKRYRHTGSHYRKNTRTSRDVVIIVVLITFAAVSWPLYVMLVWLINNR